MSKFPAFQYEDNTTGLNVTYDGNSTFSEVIANIIPRGNATTPSLKNVTEVSDSFNEVGFIVSNIKLLKAVVLCVVVLILILTMGKFILRVFSSYVDDDRKDDEISRRA